MFVCDAVVTISEFLHFPSFEGAKVSAGEALVKGKKHVTYTTPPDDSVQDIPPKSKLMKAAERPCDKVLATKERKRNKRCRKLPPMGLRLSQGVLVRKSVLWEGNSSHAPKKKIRPEQYS